MPQKGTIRSFADANREFLLTNYNSGRGTQWLATELNTHRMTVTRALKLLGVQMRTKSESQALNLKLNGHPLDGTKMSDDTKIKISEGVHNRYSNLTQEEKDRLSQSSKMRWEARPEKEKDKFKKQGILAIRETSTKGSKLENYIYRGLIEAGYDCEQHKCVLKNDKLEVDILMSKMTVAIEVDGPSHILPVWGDDALSKTHKADSDKNGLLVLNGYKVIRIQNAKKNVSNKVLRDGLAMTIKILEDIKSGKEKRNIIVEQI